MCVWPLCIVWLGYCCNLYKDRPLLLICYWYHYTCDFHVEKVNRLVCMHKYILVDQCSVTACITPSLHAQNPLIAISCHCSRACQEEIIQLMLLFLILEAGISTFTWSSSTLFCCCFWTSPAYVPDLKPFHFIFHWLVERNIRGLKPVRVLGTCMTTMLYTTFKKG